MEKAPGFTLLEILIVVLIVGILAAAGFPSMQSTLKDSRLSTASDEVLLTLEFARTSAAGSGRPTRVTIDADADTILVEQIRYAADVMDTSATQLGEAAVESLAYVPLHHPLQRSREYRINIAQKPRFAGVEILHSSFGPDSAVIFDGLGTPSKGGSVTVSVDGQSVEISLDALSGRVELN